MYSELHSFALCGHPNRLIKALYLSYSETITFETNFYNVAKRLGGEWESGRNNSGMNWKLAKRLEGEATQGEREIGRNDSEVNGKVGETTRIQFRHTL